jgi:predicted enzyme related to lactoylglutathione lyase
MILAAFAALPVAQLAPALAWYERLMGRPPDMLPNASEACWKVAEEGWIYVVEDADRAGGTLITLVVDDLDRHLSEFAERGMEVTLEERPGVWRKATARDPEGNTLSFAQPLSA